MELSAVINWGVLILIVLTPTLTQRYATYLKEKAKGYDPMNNLARYIAFASIVGLMVGEGVKGAFVVGIICFCINTGMHIKKIGIKHGIAFSMLQVFSSLLLTMWFFVILTWTFMISAAKDS